MLQTIAAGLSGLKEKFVFIGGATIELYITDPAAPLLRPTDDVDCVVAITGTPAYARLEEELRVRGFKNATGKDEPICRWEYEKIRVDIMPHDPKILGFSNRWYGEGIAHAVAATLPGGGSVSVFALPYLLASKFEASTEAHINNVHFGGSDLRLVLGASPQACLLQVKEEQRRTSPKVRLPFGAGRNRAATASFIACVQEHAALFAPCFAPTAASQSGHYLCGTQ